MELSKMIQLCILKSNGSELFSTSTTGKQLIVFDIEQLEHYTQLIILHACEEAVNLEGKSLDD